MKILTKVGIGKPFVLILSFCLSMLTMAYGASSLKLSSGLLDSELKEVVLFTPAAELTLDASTEDNLWKATAQLKIQSAQYAQKPPAPSQPQERPPLETSITQASLGRYAEQYSVRLGRNVHRPIAVSLNDSAKQFMRNPISADGVELVSILGNFEIGAFACAPQSLGSVLAARLEHLQVGLAYRYQREKPVYFPETNEAGEIVNARKATDLHEAEFTLKVPGSVMVSESVLQFTREGPYADATLFDATTQEQTLGAKNNTLPFEANDYRASTQLKYRFLEENDRSSWMIFSLGSRTFPRYHKGSTEEKTFRQSSDTDLMLASGYEIVSQRFSAQIVVYGNSSSSAKYRVFAKRNNTGEPNLSKNKFGLTFSTTFNF